MGPHPFASSSWIQLGLSSNVALRQKPVALGLLPRAFSKGEGGFLQSLPLSSETTFSFLSLYILNQEECPSLLSTHSPELQLNLTLAPALLRPESAFFEVLPSEFVLYFI